MGEFIKYLTGYRFQTHVCIFFYYHVAYIQTHVLQDTLDAFIIRRLIFIGFPN